MRAASSAVCPMEEWLMWRLALIAHHHLAGIELDADVRGHFFGLLALHSIASPTPTSEQGGFLLILSSMRVKEK
jgi:hypothetical protein